MRKSAECSPEYLLVYFEALDIVIPDLQSISARNVHRRATQISASDKYASALICVQSANLASHDTPDYTLVRSLKYSCTWIFGCRTLPSLTGRTHAKGKNALS